MTNQLLNGSFDGGVRAPNYVNGRLLTAEDLRGDRDAVLSRLTLLGKAAGHGVVEGLVVSQVGNDLQVTPGLGINRLGQAIRLGATVTLPLAIPPEASARLDDAGRFVNCGPQATGGGSAVPGGAYLLTAIPASRLEGSAPIKGAAGSTAPPGCAAKWEVEGLQFKVIRLAGFDPDGSGVTVLNRRNLLAHWCFGSAALPLLAEDPFTFGDDFAGLDALSSADFTPCDLPLAVFHWTGSQLTFADVWSARRRPVQPQALTAWRGLLSDKRLAGGQARFLQFQAQIDGIVGDGRAGSAVARDHFRFLPPVGFLPIVPGSVIGRLDRILGMAGEDALPPRIRTGGERTLLMLMKERLLARSAPKTEEIEFLAQPSLSSPFRLANASITVNPRATETGAFALLLADEIERVHVQLAEIGEQAVAASPPAAPSVNRRKRQAAKAKRLRQQMEFLRARLVALRGGARGVDLETFFGTFPTRIGIVDRETLDFTLNRSWHDEAIDLALDEPQRVEIFFVAENLVGNTNRPYVMFAKGLTPIQWLQLERRERG